MELMMHSIQLTRSCYSYEFGEPIKNKDGTVSLPCDIVFTDTIKEWLLQYNVKYKLDYENIKPIIVFENKSDAVQFKLVFM